MSAIEMVAVDRLTLADDNIRADVGDVSELASSIKAVGVLEPLLVRDDYLVVCGARRLAAAKKAGTKELPCLVRAFTEQERVEAMVIENLQREDLTPLEEARALGRLVEFGLNQRTIASRVGRSQAFVNNRLALLKLPEQARQAVHTGAVTLQQGVELAKVADDEKLVNRIVKKAVDEPYTTRSIANTVDRELGKRKRDTAVEKAEKALLKANPGLPLVRVRYDGYVVKAPKGYAIVGLGSYAKEQIDLDPAKHAKLVCHAVAVNPANVEKTLELCSQPDKHPTVQQQRDSAREKKAAELEKALEAWNEIIDRRMGWLAEWIASPGEDRRDVAVELAYLGCVVPSRYVHGREADVICRLLGIELPTEQRRYGDAQALVIEFGAVSAINRLRVVVAFSASAIESQIMYPSQAWDENTRTYLTLLERHGYELGETEEHLLAELAKAEQEEPVEVLPEEEPGEPGVDYDDEPDADEEEE